MNKIYKIIFISTLFISTMTVMSANTWISMWIGLEINLLSIIPLMINNKNMFSNEAAIKYFVIQAIASTMLLFSMIIMMNMFIDFIKFFMNMSLLLKLGAAPMHFWLPQIMEGLNWINNLILLTWQKIAPIMILSLNMNYNLLIMIIISSLIISGLMIINQISLRKIMAYSSINHIGWMLTSLFFKMNIFWNYFIIYMIISMMLIYIFYIFNIYYWNQLMIIFNNKLIIKILFILNFMSLGGLPPFLGFFPKWLIIQSMISQNLLMLSTIMVIFTLMTLYYYIQLTLNTLMFNKNELFMMKFSINNNKIIILNMISILSLIFSTLLLNNLT